MGDKSDYNTTLSQQFSPCGNFLLAGNMDGEIAVFNLQSMLNSSSSSEDNKSKPVYYFNVPQSLQVCSMTGTEQFLIVGTTMEIIGYHWDSITDSKTPKIAWTIKVPATLDMIERCDINSMVVDESSEGGLGVNLYAGCGDNKVHVFCLEDGRWKREFKGHEDYIHSIYMFESKLASCGEDGSVRFWDHRQKEHTAIVYPSQHLKLGRSHLGKWVGDVSINEDWMLCGGGPKLSLWNLRSLEPMTTFSAVEDAGIHIAKFCDDHLMVGGSSPYFYHLNHSGDVYSQIETSSTTIYSVVSQKTPHKLITLAGSSKHIDVCKNYKYKDQVISFY
ncbi:hypothetical protein WDU94_006418 [Cyamophila willieti]